MTSGTTSGLSALRSASSPAASAGNGRPASPSLHFRKYDRAACPALDAGSVSMRLAWAMQPPLTATTRRTGPGRCGAIFWRTGSGSMGSSSGGESRHRIVIVGQRRHGLALTLFCAHAPASPFRTPERASCRGHRRARALAAAPTACPLP